MEEIQQEEEVRMKINNNNPNIGVRNYCYETIRHRDIIRARKLSQAHTEEIMEEKV